MSKSNKLALFVIFLILFSIISFKFIGKKNAINERQMVYYSAQISAGEEVEADTGSGDE